MKASELRPGQFFEFVGVKSKDLQGRKMCVGQSLCVDEWSVVYLTQSGRTYGYRITATMGNVEVNPAVPQCWEGEEAAAPLQLRKGAFYERRDGQVVGPAKPSASKLFPWIVGDGGYTEDGRYNEAPIESVVDLIREVPAPPREIQAGDWVVCDLPEYGLGDIPHKVDEVKRDKLFIRGEGYHVSRFRHATAAEIEAHTRGEG